MTGTESGLQGYSATVAALEGDRDSFSVTYVPLGVQQERGPGGKPKRVPDHRARVVASDQAVRWTKPPVEGEALAKFDDDARTRVRLLRTWLDRLRALIRSVQAWAKGDDWATRPIDKPMADSAIGSYRVPALLLQKDTARIL